MKCLERYGGSEELDRAMQRSKYAKRVVECTRALEWLRKEFPDPARRPYGEIALLKEIESPHFGYPDIERILLKILVRNWTEHDLARIEGRPEPPSRD